MSDTLVAQRFNYSALPTDVADTARAVADRIKGRHKRQMEAIIETGRDLLAMKELLEHGQFQEWLHAEFAWTDRTARNYMQVVEQFADKTEIISDLPPTEVYRLASPSTPSSVRDTVVSRLEAGERIEPVEVRELVRAAKEEDHRVKAEEKMSPRQQKTREQRRVEEEQAKQEWRIRKKEAERATAELVEFIAEQLGTALPDVIRQIEVAKCKGAYLQNVIFMLQERATDE
jgi:hypothetical protein